MIIFGPRRFLQMARDLGHFVSEARGAVDEFREEISAEEVDEDQPGVEEPVEESEGESASGKE